MTGRFITAAAAGFMILALAWQPLLSPDTGVTNYYEIETPFGRMVVRLYDETPIHRDNFAKLVAEEFYDGTTFHRIQAGFMIQGGDPNSKDDDPLNDGQGDPGYTLPAEIQPQLLHKRGALAAARHPDQINPEKRSNGSQFYLVHGTPRDSTLIAEFESRIKRRHPDFSYSPDMRAHYVNVGGAPFLDMDYTVFGELVEGFDVLDAIATVDTPLRYGQRGPLENRPVQPVPMTVRALPDYTESR